ncbi:exodeoxyribonuclease VII large subunit [soil metagenome]
MSGDPATLTVAELLARVQRAVASALPGTVWVRGEVTGYRRTSGGAVFFRLADPEIDATVIDVAVRGRIMGDVDRRLEAAGVGGLRNGIEMRIRGTVGVELSRSQVRLSLLEVDPLFTVGRLAVDRQEVLRRLGADGSLAANGKLPLPLVPLRIGLVTSRGSAAHADFLDQLRLSGFRFRVSTVQASMQGEHAPAAIVRACRRLGEEPVDAVVLVRGGGSKLDLAAFDTEEVGRAVASMPVPVLAGIGHETDRSVADEAAALSVKTPSAAGEWLVSRVQAYASRLDTASVSIAEQARSACSRNRSSLDTVAARLAEVGSALRHHGDTLDHLSEGVASSARAVIRDRSVELEGLDELLSSLGLDATLRRGFVVATSTDGRVVRSAGTVAAGDRLVLRMLDGTVSVIVEKSTS